MKKSNYYEKLKDPRWQKKRLEVFERDNFTCQRCDATNKTLNVHHKVYLPDARNPWEYELEYLITLCQECHEKEKDRMQSTLEFLCFAAKKKLLTSDIIHLRDIVFDLVLKPNIQDVLMAIHKWTSEEIGINFLLNNSPEDIGNGKTSKE